MTFRLLSIVGAAIAFTLVAPVHAITIDFNAQGYVNGQALEGVTVSGVTLTSETGALIYDTNSGAGLRANVAASADITMVFGQGVSNVTVSGGDGGGDLDAFRVTVFEFGTNNLLGFFDTPLFVVGSDPDFFTLAIPGANIGRLVFDPGTSGGNLPGNSSQSGGNFLRALSFDATATPEPSAALLTTLAAAALLRRRRAA